MTRFAFYAPGLDPARIDAVVDYPDAAAAAAHAEAVGLAFLEVGGDVRVASHEIASGAARPCVETDAERLARLRALPKRLRQAAERAGVVATLPGGEAVPVDTGREDVAGLTSLVVQSRAGLVTWPVAWKGGGAFHALHGPDDVEALAAAATAHVQRAYAAEAAALAAVDAGEATTEEEVEAAFAASVNG